jgi:hypothetical protein
MRGNMATQNRRDFFKTGAFKGASAASLLIASTKAKEKSKLSQVRISVFVDTAKSNDYSFCKCVCLVHIHAICGMESKEYSIVFIIH